MPLRYGVTAIDLNDNIHNMSLKSVGDTYVRVYSAEFDTEYAILRCHLDSSQNDILTMIYGINSRVSNFTLDSYCRPECQV